MSVAPRQLLAFTFPPRSNFEGQLVGALERIESGGAMRVIGALFVSLWGDSGELVAMAQTTGSATAMVSQLLGFRLDERERRTATERALEGPAGSAIRSLATTLEPGGAVAAVLVEHTWSATLHDAIARIDGTQVVSEFVDETSVDELWAQLPGHVQRGSTPGAPNA
jgi:hypothetical protein